MHLYYTKQQLKSQYFQRFYTFFIALSRHYLVIIFLHIIIVPPKILPLGAIIKHPDIIQYFNITSIFITIKCPTSSVDITNLYTQ